SRDGQTLAAGNGHTNLRLWDVHDQPKERTVLPGHSHGPFALAYSPDGTKLATGRYGPILRLWDLRGHAPREQFVVPNDSEGARGVATLSFSPDGQCLAAGRETGDRMMRVWRLTPSGLKELTVPPTRARQVVFSPDNKSLAFSDDGSHIHLWDLTGPVPQERAALEGHHKPGWAGVVRAIAFSPDGSRLISSGLDNRVIVWDTVAGRSLQQWQLPRPAAPVAFAPDGQHVAAGS